jgi:hypothetical protein
VLLDQIREVQRASEACRARADDQNVRFELFAFDGHGVIQRPEERLK